VQALVRYRKRPIVLFALLALLVAQAGAGLHALKHFGMGGDATGLPGSHLSLCLECASFEQVAAAHGGAATAYAVAALGTDVFAPVPDTTAAARRQPASFHARAPPR
jgi:hypothetical protein